MFPILAIGAALLTGAGVAVAASADKSGKAPPRKSEAAAAATASPQSYIVTPIAGRYVQSGEPLSMADAVGKWII